MKSKRAKIWTNEMIDELTTMRAQQLSPEKIAKVMKLGKTTIYTKMAEIGLCTPSARLNKDAAFEHIPTALTPLEQAKRKLGSRWRYDPFNGYTVRDNGGNWKPVTVQAMIEMGA